MEVRIRERTYALYVPPDLAKDRTVALVLALHGGGGHTWPGGSQSLPKLLIGPVCRDFDATEALWEFFKAHPKP